jgi:ABC-type Fe3+-hydroxamate transport system substrate-binding protein
MVIDQLNREIQLSKNPLRIISVVPSQTELLFDLGLDEEVVGITKFCIHPNEWFRSKTRIGGTKNLNLDRIDELQPTLIIANKEENDQHQIEVLAQKYPVWISDIQTLDDALEMIKKVGLLVNKEERANEIIDSISFNRNQQHIKQTNLSVLYLIWYNPVMVAGTDTFIHEMIKEAGFQNIVTKTRYPVLMNEEIKALNPDVVLLSSEPFPFKEKHIQEMQLILPNANMKLVDGELFSWYGSRILKSFEYFRALNEELV